MSGGGRGRIQIGTGHIEKKTLVYSFWSALPFPIRSSIPSNNNKESAGVVSTTYSLKVVICYNE